MAKLLKPLFAALKRAGVDPKLVAVMLVAALLIGLFIVWRKKRKPAGGGDAKADPKAKVAPGAAPAAVVQKVPKDRFTKIWQRFKDDLPAVVRRSLGSFAPFVVMGTDQAATARLINGHTDWERQARFLFGSHVDDPDLKIYLGSRVLVLNMPESVLSETSSSARDALLKLWRPLFGRTPPIVVVSISPTKLMGLRPEQIGDLADSIRGKVNLLSWVSKKPVEIRVALTDLEQVDGFAELADLAERSHIPLEITLNDEISDYELEGQLNEQMAELNRFVHIGLHDLPADKFSEGFTQLVRFLRDAPAQVTPYIATFLAALMVRQPLGEQPILRTVFLTSTEGAAGPGNPFKTKAAAKKARGPLFWHKLTATVLAGVMAAGLLAGYLHERSLYIPARKALKTYLEQDSLEHQQIRAAVLRTEITTFANRTAFPGFFANAQAQMQDQLRQRILELHIVPQLDNAADSTSGLRTSVHLLSLAYASADNELGGLAQDSEMLRRWSRATKLPEDLIQEYVVSARQPNLARLRSRLKVQRFVSRTLRWNRESFNEEWQPFFRDAARIMKLGNLSRVEFISLKDRALPLTGQLALIESHPDTVELIDLLANTDSELAKLRQILERDLLELQRPETFRSQKRGEIARFMARVISTELRAPPQKGRLDELCLWLQQTLAPPTVSGGAGFLSMFVSAGGSENLAEFQIDDIVIREKDWLRLTRDNSIREALRSFQKRASSNGSLFFSAADRFDDLELNPDTLGEFLFAGKARIPGAYTKAAVRERIIPPLECLGGIYEQLNRVAGAETADLTVAIERDLEGYSSQYGRYMTDYYRAFRLNAKSTVSNLQSILNRLMQGSSPLNRHLIVVADNSRLPEHGAFAGRYLAPLAQRLEGYRVLQEVATSTKTAGTPLGDYLGFVAQIQETLKVDPTSDAVAIPEAPALPDATPAAMKPLEELLSPAGLMAFQMLQCSPDSPLTQIEGWLDEVQMPKALRSPFLTLMRQLYLVGRRNIQDVTARQWNQHVVTDLQAMILRFPFQPLSSVDVTEAQLNDFFHPLTGRFSLVKQTYLDPIRTRVPGCRFRYANDAPLPPVGSTLLLPEIHALTSRLWDAAGQSQPLRLMASPVAFKSRLLLKSVGTREVDPAKPEYLDEVLTLTFLSSGQSTLVNFNQRPFSKELVIDWSKAHPAQVGVRLTHPETRDEVLPKRLTEASNWALLRLLKRSERAGRRYTWTVPVVTDAGGSQTKLANATVAFDLDEDPFKLFQLQKTPDAQAQLIQPRSPRR